MHVFEAQYDLKTLTDRNKAALPLFTHQNLNLRLQCLLFEFLLFLHNSIKSKNTSSGHNDISFSIIRQPDLGKKT